MSKIYKIRIDINLGGFTDDQIKAIKTARRTLLFAISWQLENVRGYTRHFSFNKKEVADLPLHSLFCECRKCNTSFNKSFRIKKSAYEY